MGDSLRNLNWIRYEWWNIDHPQRINSGIGTHQLDRPRILGRGGRGNHVNGVRYPRLRWEYGARRRLRLRSKFWQHETMRFAGIREQNARPTRVRDDAHTWSWWHRLGGQQHSDIKEFLQGISTDDTGLLEQRLDRGIARRESR